MTRANGGESRRRGNIRERGGSLQVRVYAGIDPVTNKDRYLVETIKGTDRAARRLAEKTMTRLQALVDQQRSTETSSASFCRAHRGPHADIRCPVSPRPHNTNPDSACTSAPLVCGTLKSGTRQGASGPYTWTTSRTKISDGCSALPGFSCRARAFLAGGPERFPVRCRQPNPAGDGRKISTQASKVECARRASFEEIRTPCGWTWSSWVPGPCIARAERSNVRRRDAPTR
jgi:hypothetical protein